MASSSAHALRIAARASRARCVARADDDAALDKEVAARSSADLRAQRTPRRRRCSVRAMRSATQLEHVRPHERIAVEHADGLAPRARDAALHAEDSGGEERVTHHSIILS